MAGSVGNRTVQEGAGYGPCRPPSRDRLTRRDWSASTTVAAMLRLPCWTTVPSRGGGASSDRVGPGAGAGYGPPTQAAARRRSGSGQVRRAIRPHARSTATETNAQRAAGFNPAVLRLRWGCSRSEERRGKPGGSLWRAPGRATVNVAPAPPPIGTESCLAAAVMPEDYIGGSGSSLAKRTPAEPRAECSVLSAECRGLSAEYLTARVWDRLSSLSPTGRKAGPTQPAATGRSQPIVADGPAGRT